MIKAIIIDDEKRARVSLALLLQEYCPEVAIVAQCENLPEGIKAIVKNQPDVVLLDIEMPGHSGLELIDFFDEKDVNFSIIFTTAYNEFAIQAFKLSALDYLLKPISPDELVRAIERVQKQLNLQFKIFQENLRNDQFQKIAVPSGNTLILLQLNDILYIKGEGAYSEIFMIDNTKHMVSRNLKKFEDILENDNRFLRIHKSFIVNFDHVVSYNKSDGGWLNLKQQVSLPVSPDRSAAILDQLHIIKR